MKKERVAINTEWQGRQARSAGFQPAVSPISNRQGVENTRRAETFARFAGWKPCDTAGRKPALRREVSSRFANRLGHFSAAVVVAVFALALPLPAQEWARFHGPNGTGISEAKGIPTNIGDSCMAWKVELPGSGHSSPVLWGDKLFITCTGDNSGGISVLCLTAKDGKQEWKRDFDLTPFSKHKFNSFASSSPAVDPERIY